MAQEAGVKRLVLVHVGPHLASHGPMEKGIGDVRKIYDGEIIFADELMIPPALIAPGSWIFGQSP